MIAWVNDMLVLAGELFACAQKERLSEQRELIWVSLGARYSSKDVVLGAA